MILPGAAITAPAALTLLPVAWPASVVLIALAALAVGVELPRQTAAIARGRSERAGTPDRPAISRQHGASLYRFGADITRYYSLPLLGASLLWWPLLLPTLVLLLSHP